MVVGVGRGHLVGFVLGEELDALVGAVAEIGSIVGVPTPALDHVFALAKLLEERTLAT